MTNLENEITLLYQWLSGNHREDIAHFEPDVFHYKTLFEDIREGITVQKLGANITDGKYKGIESLNDIVAECTSPFYYGALGDGLKEQRRLYINQFDKHPEEQEHWLNKITHIQNILNGTERPDAVAGFSDLFLNRLREIQTEKCPQYGIKELDGVTNGLHRGQLVTVCARPSCGKSVFGLQVADNVREAGYRVLYIPLEMTPYETFKRLIAGWLDVEKINDIETEGLTENQEARVTAYLNELEKERNFIICPTLDRLADIERKIKEEKPYLVVLDQLSLVTPMGKAKDVREKYMQVTDKLKKLTIQEDICILALHQLNRDSENKEVVGLTDLAESDSVGRDSDVVLVFNTKEKNPQFDAPKGLIKEKLRVVKNRNGEAGKSIYLGLDGNRAKFYPIEEREYEGAVAYENMKTI